MALIPRLLLAFAFVISLVEGALATHNVGELVPRFAPWTGWPLLGLAGLVGAVGAAAWARRPTSILAAGAALAPIIGVAILERLVDPTGVHHGKLLPAAALIAWMVGVRSAGGSAERGVEAAAGVVAAAYTLAALAKVQGAGASWFEPSYIGLLVLERAVDAPEPLAALRMALVERPWACSAVAWGSIAIEGGAALYVWRPARRVVAVAIVALHIGIALFMGYFYVRWALVVVAFAWPLPVGAASAARD